MTVRKNRVALCLVPRQSQEGWSDSAEDAGCNPSCYSVGGRSRRHTLLRMKPSVNFGMPFRHCSRHCRERPGLPADRLYKISEGAPGDRQQSKVVEVYLGQRGYYIALTPSVEGVACSLSASCRPLAWSCFALVAQSHLQEVLANHGTHYRNPCNLLEVHSLHLVLGEVLVDILWEEARDLHLLAAGRTRLGLDGYLNLHVHLVASFVSDSCPFSTFDPPFVAHSPCPVFVCLVVDTVARTDHLEDS